MISYYALQRPCGFAHSQGVIPIEAPCQVGTKDAKYRTCIFIDLGNWLVNDHMAFSVLKYICKVGNPTTFAGTYIRPKVGYFLLDIRTYI